MEALASVGALHPTVTSKEVTAHAKGKAMGLVGTQELGRPNGRDGQGFGGRRRPVVVKLASQLGPIPHAREFSAMKSSSYLILLSARALNA